MKVSLTKIKIDDEDLFWLKITEISVKETWDNEFDERWDKVLNHLV